MTNEEAAIKIAELDQRAKSNTRRVEKLEIQTEAIQSLATSVEILVREQRHQTEAVERIEKNVDKLNVKVEVLEQKPAKRWDNIVEKVVWLLVGGVIAFAFASVGIPL